MSMEPKARPTTKVYVPKRKEGTEMGRGVSGLGDHANPAGRFDRLQVHEDPDLEPAFEEETRPGPRTEFFRDASRTILSTNDSPDIGFDASVNPYRGCEHGCIYCFARPTHEYLGLSAGLDFETKIFVKHDAAELLREKLMSKSWKPQVVQVSGVTDCYQPIERKLKITRSVLEVLGEFRNPVSIVTKNHLVTRDIDLFQSMAKFDGIRIWISITSLDAELIERMEPRTSRPAFRLKAVESLAKAGIPVGILMAPVIPGLTDHEMPQILESAANAGAQFAGYTVLRLPYGLGDLFEAWVAQNFPDRKDKIINRIRSLRGGKINDANFNSRMRGEGVFADQLRSMFKLYTKKSGLNQTEFALSSAHFQLPQLDLFHSRPFD